ncbi:hypothetical protein GF312_03325 [Candidatus Poribacteria bacterium]|nr:hypothetical protein [Candidatus Poribacteria bacterium]
MQWKYSIHINSHVILPLNWFEVNENSLTWRILYAKLGCVVKQKGNIMNNTQLTGNASDFLEIVVAAAGRGDLETVRKLVDDKPEWIHTVGSHGRTMLWEAVYRGKMNVVKFLVERGADVNAVGCNFSESYVEISPYCVARVKRRYEIAEYLLENGADVDIYTAAYLGDYNKVNSILEEKPQLLEQEHAYTEKADEPIFHATPIFYAVSGGNPDVVKLLISKGADIYSQSEKLFNFAMRNTQVVRVLLQNDLDISEMKFGPPPDDEELTDLMISYGAKFDVNAIDKGWPELVYRSRGDKGEHPEEIERLLKLGADINIRNYKERTAMHVAAQAGFKDVIEVLVNNGADVNPVDMYGETPLFSAVKSNIRKTHKKIATVGFLIENGANLSVKNLKGQTVLDVARLIKRDKAEVITKMLEDAINENDFF